MDVTSTRLTIRNIIIPLAETSIPSSRQTINAFLGVFRCRWFPNRVIIRSIPTTCRSRTRIYFRTKAYRTLAGGMSLPPSPAVLSDIICPTEKRAPMTTTTNVQRAFVPFPLPLLLLMHFCVSGAQSWAKLSVPRQQS